MDIIKAEIKDAKEIATLIKAGWNSAYKGLISLNFLKNMNKEEMAIGWKENIEINQNIYVYKIKDEIKGIIKFGQSEDGNYGEVYVLYVKPEEKRQGIGTKLFTFAKEKLVEEGYNKMVVWCLKGNKQGLNFYKKMQGKYIGNRDYEIRGLKIEEEGYIYNLVEKDNIILVNPTIEHKEQLIKYKKEHFNVGEDIIHGCSRWDKMDSYEEWLQLLKSHSSWETITDNWTVHTNFLGIREKDYKVIGMIDIRHQLTNDFLKNYAGHIGYGVRPSERRKGYASQMLKQALEYCKNELNLERVMISCDKNNIGSKKTIINAGGVLEEEYTTENGEIVQVHWIEL